MIMAILRGMLIGKDILIKLEHKYYCHLENIATMKEEN